MQRDNSFDLGLRDIADIRNAARHARDREHAQHDVAGVGAACGINGANMSTRPSCDSTDLDYLERYFATTVASTRNLAGGATALITFDPLDQYFCPVAIAASVSSTADPTLPRVAWFLDANIRKCTQFDFTNAVETAAGATAWIASSEWDPFARSGCACRINWGCFTNVGTRSAILTVLTANPTASPIDVKLTIYGVGYTCCPGFVVGGEQVMHIPSGREGGPVVAQSPPAPIGRASDRVPFARQG